MSGATDSGMVKTMGIVMGALALLAILCVTAARLLGVGADDSDDPLKRNALIQRIQPVGMVRTSADDLPGTAEVLVADAGGAMKTGEELVNGACAACHIAGVAGAPILGDEAAWAERRELGLDALVASVINGKGAMAARGGSTYTDEEIELAVRHMAMFEDESAAVPVESETATAAAPVEAEEAPAAEVAETTAAVEEAPAAEVVAEAEAVAESAAEAEPAEVVAEVVAEEAPVAEVAASAGAAALVVGQVPEGVNDNIRSAVNGVCAGCHLAGVAGAPKNGDKEAWQLRADKGLDALVASVTNGLNVMPPRGGSGLTDEEIPIAIQYLMSK